MCLSPRTLQYLISPPPHLFFVVFCFRGSEFKSTSFQSVLRKRGIRHLFANNREKSALAERGLGILQLRLHRMMKFRNSFRFIDDLQNMVKSINDSPHASLLNIAPSEFIEKRDLYPIWATYHMRHLKKLPSAMLPEIKFKFRLGQSVRVSRLTSGLSKAYDGTFSNEIFKIVARRHSRPPSYELTDILNNEVKGQFYEPELIAVSDREDQEYMVNNIIRRYTDPNTKTRMAVVNWVGWPKGHHSDIPEKNITVTSRADGDGAPGSVERRGNSGSAATSPFAPSAPAPEPEPRPEPAARPSPRRPAPQTATQAAPRVGMTLRPRNGRIQ